MGWIHFWVELVTLSALGGSTSGVLIRIYRYIIPSKDAHITQSSTAKKTDWEQLCFQEILPTPIHQPSNWTIQPLNRPPFSVHHVAPVSGFQLISPTSRRAETGDAMFSEPRSITKTLIPLLALTDLFFRLRNSTLFESARKDLPARPLGRRLGLGIRLASFSVLHCMWISETHTCANKMHAHMDNINLYYKSIRSCKHLQVSIVLNL